MSLDDLERHLVRGERRVIKVRRHPAALLGALGKAGAALIVVLVLLWTLPPDATLAASVVFYAGVLVLALLAHEVAQWWVERIVVTDRRVLLSSGVIVTRVAMMPLRKVTDLTFEHTVSGRALGYFTMVVESAGQSQALSRIEYLPAPQRLRRAISELLFGDGGAAGAADPEDAMRGDDAPTEEIPRMPPGASGTADRATRAPH